MFKLKLNVNSKLYKMKFSFLSATIVWWQWSFLARFSSMKKKLVVAFVAARATSFSRS